MKVVIISPSLNPEENVSGISSVVQFIISNNKAVDYIHFEVGRKDSESIGVFSRIRRIWHNRIEFKRLLRLHEGVVIHYNMQWMGGAVVRDSLLLQVAYKRKNPIVLHVHGGNYLKNRQRPWFIQRLIEKVFSWAKCIIVLSDEEKRIIGEDFKVVNVHSLPNCIDLAESRTFERKYESNHPLSILYLGRIEKNKGIDYILDAAKRLIADGVPFTLHFAGKEDTEGEYIPKFQTELGASFGYHGVVFGEAKNDLLKQCDVFLLPSFYEGLPMSLIETMSFGMIPIVTNVGSISSIVVDGKNGLFVGVKDVDSIVVAIKAISSQKVLMETLSDNAQKTILSLFDDRIYISRLNSLYC